MYQEIDLPGIGTLWRSTASETPAVIPADGCADIILRDDALVVAGPSTRSIVAAGPASSETRGLRFPPGMASTALGIVPGEVRNRVVAAEDVLSAQLRASSAAFLRDAWADPTSGAQAASARSEGYARRRQGFTPGNVQLLGRSEDHRWVDAARAAAHRGDSAATLAALLGYSERQLQRRMVAQFGYGYAVLRRVVRAGHAQSLIRAGAPLAGAASLSGFSDQAHLTREFRELVGQTPSEFAARAHTGH